MNACKPTRYLKGSEVMLNKQKIKGNKKFSSYDLEEFYQNQPNRKFFLLPFRPYLHLYYHGESIFDSAKVNTRFDEKVAKIDRKIIAEEDSIKQDKLNFKKEEIEDKRQLVLKGGNWLMRSVGEKIAIYDSSLSENSAQQMYKYLHSKGHFRADVEYSTKINRRKAKVTYRINEKEPYVIKSNKILADDKKLSKLLPLKASLLQNGLEYSDRLLSEERVRITEALKGAGYFHFNQKYVFFEVDSSIEKHHVYIHTIVKNPNDGSKHEKYNIKNIYFTTDAGVEKVGKSRDTIIYNNVNYLWYERNVSEKILNRKIRVKPDELYNHFDVIQTQKNIADLNMYKFVNINFYETEDSLNNHLNCYISTSKFEKYQFTAETGINVFQGLPGPFAKISYKARNLLRGSEIIDLNIRGGIEGQSSILQPDQILATQEYAATGAISFPKFFLPTSILKKYNDYNPKTQFQLSGKQTFRPEFTRDNLTASYAYLWQKTKNKRFVITPLELTLINTRNETNLFRQYIDDLKANNNPLYLSFRKSIISSIRYDFIFDNNLNKQKKESQYFRLSLESGGTTLNFIQKDIFDEPTKIFGLDYYQYLKGLTDFRYYIPTKNKNILATRLAFGIAKTIGLTNALPYEKYFFSGGSYSNRAWLPRRLGPGSYTPLNSNGEFDKNYRIEQPGEVLFESNIEYRFRLKGILDGALFTDIGNVWTINDDARDGSRFSSDFTKELAVGAGFGFRFDFSFLILRLDIGSKIWDPALDLEDRFTPKNNSVPQILLDDRLTVVNLGIGYPF